MALFKLTVLLFVLTSVWSFECGNLQFSPSTVQVSGSVELIYAYAHGNRYQPRLWYRLQGKVWTKLYDSTQGQAAGQKYQERFRDDNYVLTISSVTLSDVGNYVVICSTHENRLSQTAELKVIPQAVQQGLCGRLEILANGSPVGTYVQFKFETSVSQQYVLWQRDVGGDFRNLGRERGVELTNNVAQTVFARKLYSSSSDIGIYRVQCLDGTVSNIVELAVYVVPPGKPIIEQTESFPGCKDCLFAVPATLLHINCVSYNGSAPVDLKLYFNHVKINSAVSQVVTRRQINVEKYQRIQTTDENAVITCTAINSAMDAPISTDVRVYLYKEPVPPVIQVYNAAEGKTATITCVSTGGKPAPSLLFTYNNSIFKPTNQHSVNKKDGTFRVESVLFVNLTRSDNHRDVDCYSETRLKRKKESKKLLVKFPPKEVRVNKIQEVSSSPAGDTNLTLRCTTGESNPKSTVIWQGLDTIKRAPNSDNGNVGSNGGRSFYHDLTVYLTKKDNGREIKCMVMNVDFPDLVLETSYRVNITYQPLITIVGGPNITAYDGSDVIVTCSADSNPRSRLRWSKDGALINESIEGSTVKLTLHNITLYNDSSVFTCSAENGVGVIVTSDVTIFVKEKNLAIHSASQAESHAETIVGVLCVTLFLVAMVIIALIFIRRRRRSALDGCPSGVQMRIEDRQPSIHPPVEEPVYNNLVNQDHGDGGSETAEYAQVIPKSQRNIQVVDDTQENNSEYAVVIPRSQRKPVDNELNVEQQHQDSTSTSNLVYADLDLNLTGNSADRIPVTRQQSATQYVSIDFVKSKEINEKQSET